MVTLRKRKEQAFNEIVRRVRKECFGKGPERIHTMFVENIAISVLHGNLTPTEKFISQTPEGAEIVRAARTNMIQTLYSQHVPDGMEELIGSKMLYLFSDFKVEEDMGVSVFIFEKPIDPFYSENDP
ncbi:DUF2294 domain-containing protein [Alicyclobacillus acidoterrestris]|uniref:DUF2294 domain-containing protein n=1 Tax=Alicyclobacillus acidoterrestris (strain ATCC 49025 / DSM 3922 / CIP 106132 / NCIMB 13137 / GD3B) TaxID=1356854 RepID=T0BPN8_ALIAG|nr:DUF2294 domain-containing protein [Alicyclobacillus acidoterrestris]EPZ42734.1 hypothetical protein N007_14380 [Alicyclobacillus acidoterrestris ATCC 49025]UNO50117.1 DUF2294 domain-containing protein [Alicyclobacillus acidoterrestris]